jgi:hypothetical protein
VKSNSRSWSLQTAAAASVILWLFTLGGCASRPKSNGAEQGSGSDSAAAHIDVMCVGDRIEKPTEAFHYSYNYSDASRWVNDEADITPQSMDITTKDKSGTHVYHGARSDEASWNSAVLDLSGLSITTMSARLDSLNGGSAIVSQGAEALNGYQTTKYSIDTTSAKSADQKTFAVLFGPGSFDKGTVWMGQDGCVVKLVLDEGVSQMNGGVEKRHYEIARSRK